MDFPAMDDATMDDAALVRRASEGQTAAFDALFQRYAKRIHDFLAWVLQDTEESGFVLYDTFAEVGSRIDQLLEPARVRPWLFAVASRHALRHRGGAGVAGDAATETGGAWGELLQVVRAVGRDLSPRERALLDLRFRQGFEGDDLAAAVGVPADEATAQVDRLVERVEQALSLSVVAHLGTRDCPELKVLLADWDGHLDNRQRPMLEEHAERCAICGPRRRRHIPASSLLGVAPAAAIPPGLRERLLDDVELGSHRGRSWPARRGGFPPALLAAHDLRRRLVAVAAAVILVATATFLVTRDGKEGEEVASVGTTIRPTSTTIAARTTTVPPSSSSTTPPDGQAAGAAPTAGGTGTSATGGGGTAAGGGTGTGTGGTGTGGGSTGGGGGGSGTTSTTAAPPPPPDTTTTTPAPDETPPTLSNLSVSPSAVRASGCSGGGDTTATVSVTATDASGIGSVRATVAGPASDSTALSHVGGGVYRGTIGPFESPLPPGVDFPAHVVVSATDTQGNTGVTNTAFTIRCGS